MGEGVDSDGDGLSDDKEAQYGTDPNVQDTDGDRECDGLEVSHGSNPLLSTDRLEDHMPAKPAINPVAGDVPLTGAVFDMSAFSDPDADNTVGLTTWFISQVDSATQVQTAIMLVEWGPEISGSELKVPDGVLQAGQTYTITARYEDNTKLSSLWVDPVTVTTVPANPQDQDGNGVADDAQVDAFVDTNGNGVDDHLEGIVPVFDSAGHNPVGVQASQGHLDWVAVTPVSALPVDQQPQDVMPYGLFNFRITGLPLDYGNPARVQVTFYFSGTLPDNLHWFKYDPTSQAGYDATDHITIAGNQVTLELRDGERQADLDGQVNGIIVDPGGPVLTAASAGDVSTPVSQNTGGGDTTGTAAAGSQAGDTATPVTSADTSPRILPLPPIRRPQQAVTAAYTRRPSLRVPAMAAPPGHRPMRLRTLVEVVPPASPLWSSSWARPV